MRAAPLALLLTLCFLLSGCQKATTPPAGSGSPEAPVEETPTADPEPMEEEAVEELVPQTDATLDPEPAELPDLPADAVDPTSAADQPATDEPDTEQVTAQAGVGTQGQDLEPGNMITEPARVFFNAKQKIAFIQVEQNLRLYEATNGSVPQSTEEFMKEVVDSKGVKLPELPRGHRYVFDPEAGKLLVEKPKS